LFRVKEQTGRHLTFMLKQMAHYRGYTIKIEAVRNKWRCSVSPMRSDLPILWHYYQYYDTFDAAHVDAARRIDEALAG
jgi:hypothetical protein